MPPPPFFTHILYCQICVSEIKTLTAAKESHENCYRYTEHLTEQYLCVCLKAFEHFGLALEYQSPEE